MKYGKYLNKIDTEIPVEHLLVENVSEISRSVEPGEPNLPSPESYTVQIANLEPDGTERYPLEFWQNASRSEEEGATQELQLYVQIFINDQPQFTGVLKRVRYTKYDAICSLELMDFTDLIRAEDRSMLKGFAFTIPYPNLGDDDIGIVIDGPETGYNDLPSLKSLDGDAIPQESITFQLFASAHKGGRERGDGGPSNISSGKFDALNSDGTPVYPFAFHLGWEAIDFVEPVSSNDGLTLIETTRPTYVQIDEITLFTRCRFWIRQVSIGPQNRIRQELLVTIWHNATEPAGGVIPRGRFLWDNELITSQTEDMEIVFHEPNFGYDDDVAINAGLLPLDENFIFGLPFTEVGGDIQLTSAEYAYFDVMQKTREIINADISIRHTDQGLSGWVEITAFDPDSSPGTVASTDIIVNFVPFETKTLKFQIRKDGEAIQESAGFTFTAGESINTFLTDIQAAIIAGSMNSNWEAEAPDGNSVTLNSRATGEEWNGYEILIFEFVSGSWNGVLLAGTEIADTAGGTTGGFVADSIDLKIGETVFATTSNVDENDTLADIAERVFDAAVAVGDADYEFTLDGERVDVVSIAGSIQALSLDVGTTNVSWESQPITSSFDIFDVSKLLDEYRLAFYADAIMFGWLEQSVIDSLVAVGWQTSAQIFTTAEGKIAIHSRSYFEEFPDDINSPDFDATLITDAEWEPASGNTYDEGFSSYEAEVYQDIIEVNNVRSNQEKKIYADKNGTRSRPALNNKKVSIGNYRLFNLSVYFQEIPYRYSPADEIWPGEPLSRFLPSAQEQLNILARLFPFPITATTLRIYWPDHESVDVGEYIYGEDNQLWLVKNIRISPRSLVATLEIEFKKAIVEFGQSYKEEASIGEKFTFRQIVRESYKEEVSIGEPVKHSMSFADEMAIDEAGAVTVSEEYSEAVIVDEEEIDGIVPDAPENFAVDLVENYDELTISRQYIEGVDTDEDWSETVTPPET